MKHNQKIVGRLMKKLRRRRDQSPPKEQRNECMNYCLTALQQRKVLSAWILVADPSLSSPNFFFYNVWTKSVPKALRNQCQPNSLGNVILCQFQLDGVDGFTNTQFEILDNVYFAGYESQSPQIAAIQCKKNIAIHQS